ncbi:MAG: carbon storage regulator CsrA [Planctomycetota bacterium]
MLVLTRSSNEEIRIGDDIVVRVLDIRGDRVRIGIDAPAHVTVHRQEVYQEIATANLEALRVAGAGLSGAQELIKARAARTHKTPTTNSSPPRVARQGAAVKP